MLSLILATYLVGIAAADWTCDPDCAIPFPPGHQNISHSWWAIGGEDSGAYITSLTTLLSVPRNPQGLEGLRVINPALENTNVYDLSDRQVANETYQILLSAFPDHLDPNTGFLHPTGCNTVEGGWCIYDGFFINGTSASETVRFLPNHTIQAVNPGDTINLTYSYDPDTVGINESYEVLGGGQAPWSLSHHPYEPPFQWWAKTECFCSGLIPQHTYKQTKITLNRAVPDFSKFVKNRNADFTPIYTSDKGITWHLDSLTIPESICHNANPYCDEHSPYDTNSLGAKQLDTKQSNKKHFNT